MRKLFYKFLAILMRRNISSTPVDVILDQMKEPRQLPLGKQEFEEWAERVISSVPPLEASKESLKFALATMILHLGPQESHKEDLYFAKSLLKSAANQVAATVIQDIKKAQLEEVKASGEETLKRIDAMAKTSEATQSPESVADGKPVQN